MIGGHRRHAGVAAAVVVVGVVLWLVVIPLVRTIEGQAIADPRGQAEATVLRVASEEGLGAPYNLRWTIVRSADGGFVEPLVQRRSGPMIEIAVSISCRGPGNADATVDHIGHVGTRCDPLDDVGLGSVTTSRWTSQVPTERSISVRAKSDVPGVAVAVRIEYSVMLEAERG